MKRLALFAFLLLPLLPITATAEPGILEHTFAADEATGSFEGTIVLPEKRRLKAKLHIQTLFRLSAVLAIADPDGIYGGKLVFRFSKVQYDPDTGAYFMYAESYSPIGEGRGVYVIEATRKGSALTGVFKSNLITPEGEVVGGPINMKKY